VTVPEAVDAGSQDLRVGGADVGDGDPAESRQGGVVREACGAAVVVLGTHARRLPWGYGVGSLMHKRFASVRIDEAVFDAAGVTFHYLTASPSTASVGDFRFAP
jgi:hypothetical protein